MYADICAGLVWLWRAINDWGYAEFSGNYSRAHDFRLYDSRYDLYLEPWLFVFFSSRRRHTIFDCDWSSDVCSSDLHDELGGAHERHVAHGDAGIVYAVDQEAEAGVGGQVQPGDHKSQTTRPLSGLTDGEALQLGRQREGEVRIGRIEPTRDRQRRSRRRCRDMIEILRRVAGRDRLGEVAPGERPRRGGRRRE